MARALAGLAVLAAVALGCGDSESSEERTVGEVESALRAAGLQVCGTPDAGEPPEDADREEAFVVAIECGDEDDQAVVTIVAWPDDAARDAALRRFEVYSRPTTRSHGTTFALGRFTIAVSGERDDAVVARVADAMDRLGAS
jgi:hypothetical protein